MSVISTADWIERHRITVRFQRAGTTVPFQTIVPLLREGWDYFSPDGATSDDLLGMPRFPHLAIHGDVDPNAIPGIPVFTTMMTACEIESGIYRQCRIRPESLADGTSVADNPYHILSDFDYDPQRAWIFRTITGHAPRDVSLYLAHELALRPEIGKLLLAKDFKSALQKAPDLLTATDWPEVVKHSWSENGGANYLPPFVVLTIIAEFARLAMNDRGLIKLSFDDDGLNLTTRRMLDGMLPIGDAEVGVLPTSPRITHLTEMVAFQTTVLLPPTMAFKNSDTLLGRAWSHTSASVVPTLIAYNGPEVVDHMLSRDTDAAARRLHANINAHPQFWPEGRKKYGCSLQHRSAVQSWNLDRRQNVAVGLLEIALDAQKTSAALVGIDRPLVVSKKDLANAIQMVVCLWLEEGNTAAAGVLGNDIRRGFRNGTTGETTIFDDDMLDDVCGRDGFGRRLLNTAYKLIENRAEPGEEGYSARYKAHLWYCDYDDDLPVYRRYQAKAFADHLAVRSGKGGFPMGTTDSVLGRSDRADSSGANAYPLSRNMGPRPFMTMDPEAALGARDKAMMITASGLDPMRAFLARPPARAISMNRRRMPTKSRRGARRK